jgi:hypothetical protein
MVRAFGAFCCFIVGLQLLIGVPAAVCVAFFAMFGGLGPIAIEIHPGASTAPHMLMHSATIAPPSSLLAIAPPPNVIPPAPTSTTFDNPILETRAQQGSPLAGTVLSENTPPDVERDLFVAAFQKVSAEAQTTSTSLSPTINAPTAPGACTMVAANSCCQQASARAQADQLAIQRLYEMADIDERSGNYERADQWQALARQIRQADKGAPAVSTSTENASAQPPSLDLP